MSDTVRGPHPRFSPAAVERAKAKFGTSEISKIGDLLGYSRPGFHRARTGKQDTRLSHAKRIAKQLDMPIDDVFVDGTDA